MSERLSSENMFNDGVAMTIHTNAKDLNKISIHSAGFRGNRATPLAQELASGWFLPDEEGEVPDPNHALVVFDPLNTGESRGGNLSDPRGLWKPSDLVESLRVVIKTLEARFPGVPIENLLGHSLGGWAIMVAALEMDYAPNLHAALTPANSEAFGVLDKVREQAAQNGWRVAQDGGGEVHLDDEVFKDFERDCRLRDCLGALAIARRFPGVHLYISDGDTYVNAEYTKALIDEFAGSWQGVMRLHEVPGVPHDPEGKRAKTLATAIRRNVRRTGAGGVFAGADSQDIAA